MALSSTTVVVGIDHDPGWIEESVAAEKGFSIGWECSFSARMDDVPSCRFKGAHQVSVCTYARERGGKSSMREIDSGEESPIGAEQKTILP